MKILALLLALITPALAQSGKSTIQSGNVTPNHAVCWVSAGILGDCGTAASSVLNTLGVTGPSCVNSGAITGPYNQLCFQPTSTGGGFTWYGYGGATGSPTFTVNGTVYQFPFSTTGVVGPSTTTSGDTACWNNTVGTLLSDCGISLKASNNLSDVGSASSSRTNLGLASLYTVAGVTHEWIASVTGGVPTLSQPAFSDLSGTASASQIPAVPLNTGSSTGNTLTAPSGYFVCTATCTVTPPVPAAGYQFCVMNDDNVSGIITLGALGSSARYENTARTAYGTAGTGTLSSGGAVGDMICIVGRDSTHYLSPTYVGTWMAS